MQPDTEKIDEAVLALLHLTLHEDARVWKSHDWDTLRRLHEKGLISDPVGKTKSVSLTEQGSSNPSVCLNSYSASGSCNGHGPVCANAPCLSNA